MNLKQPNPVGDPAPSNFKANLVLALLVFGVPVGAKLVLQSARAASSEQIVSTQPLVVPRHGHSATVVPGGRVLVVGGVNANGAVAAVEIYDPVTRVFTSAGVLVVPRAGHTATRFSDNSVLLAGGSAAAQDSLESFNPADLSFTLSPFLLATPHSGHAAIPTLDGQLLIFGGNNSGTVEEFDPTTLQV